MSIVSLYPETRAARTSGSLSRRHRVGVVGQRPRLQGAAAPWRVAARLVAARLVAARLVAARLVATVTLWRARARARRELARLDAHLLHDIGMDRNTARFEASKPFWQA